MSPIWQELLAADEERVLPWLGQRKLAHGGRVWRIAGELPAEYGWYCFRTGGARDATVLGPAEPDPAYEDNHPVIRGYLTGDRLVPDDARVDPNPARLIEQTERVFLVEPGLERFCRAVTARCNDNRLVYVRQEFPRGPEDEAQRAYEDRMESIDHVAHVTPPLDLAFRWLTWQRFRAEERARRHRERVAEQERLERAAETRERMRRLGVTGDGAARRALARQDFDAAARAALRISGAELLDARPAFNQGEMVVQYRFRHQRLECVVDRHTLRVTDAGVCLTDEATGEHGDGYFTLESLPAVIGEAMDLDVLVVYRHA